MRNRLDKTAAMLMVWHCEMVFASQKFRNQWMKHSIVFRFNNDIVVIKKYNTSEEKTRELETQHTSRESKQRCMMDQKASL